MSQSIELNKAIFRAAQEQDQNLGVFSTSDPDVFLQAARLAYRADQHGAPFRLDENGNLDAGQMFVFRTYVLKLAEQEKDKLRQKFQSIWDNAAAHDIERLHQDFKVSSREEFPRKIQVEGLSIEQQIFLLTRIGSMAKTLEDITGANACRIHVYPNFERITPNGHPPTHPFSVVNETWLEAGTVMTNEDGEELTRIDEGDRFFMLANTYHSPPTIKFVDGRPQINPRISLITNEFH